MGINDRDKLLLLNKLLRDCKDKGVRMKDVANALQLPPSVLSALFATVLPVFEQSIATMQYDEALEYALSQVNNVSKKRLIHNLDQMIEAIHLMEQDLPELIQKPHPFMQQFLEEINTSAQSTIGHEGLYLSYSCSSSSEALKIEPFFIQKNDDCRQYVIGRRNVYGAIHEGVAIIKEHNVMYIMFNESNQKNFAMVTIYIQLPFFENPQFLKGLYLTLDYNKNPIARRIVLKKISDNVLMEDFHVLEAKTVEQQHLTDEEKHIYDYTCQRNDSIKMCAIPSPRLDVRDLITEKKILEIQ